MRTLGIPFVINPIGHVRVYAYHACACVRESVFEYMYERESEIGIERARARARAIERERDLAAGEDYLAYPFTRRAQKVRVFALARI